MLIAEASFKESLLAALPIQYDFKQTSHVFLFKLMLSLGYIRVGTKVLHPPKSFSSILDAYIFMEGSMLRREVGNGIIFKNVKLLSKETVGLKSRILL